MVVALFVSVIIGGASGAGLATVVLLQLSSDVNSNDDHPVPSACCSTGEPLTGRFVGNVSTTKTVIGHELAVRFSMTHEFRAHNASGGVVDVSLTAFESPFSVLEGFRCATT